MNEPQGIDRSGDPLLSLAEEHQPYRDAIVATTYFYSRLTGLMEAPIGKKWAARQLEPQVGDLVFIPDAMRKQADDRQKGFGYLVERHREPIYTEELWSKVRTKGASAKPPTEEVFYVQYGPAPGDVCRWENARCQTIPTEKLAEELWRNGRW